MKVIEPSEIIVEGRGQPKGVKENPWARFLARFMDYSLFLLALWGLNQLFHDTLTISKYEHFIPIEYFLWIPLEALLLYTLGTTPGKWWLKIKIHWPKPRIDYMAALQRSFSVWFRGLGMGIPILNILCLMTAFHKLKLFHRTSWDRDAHTSVTHKPVGRFRLGVAAAIALTGFVLYYFF